MKETILSALGYRKFGCIDDDNVSVPIVEKIEQKQIEKSHVISEIPMGLLSTETLDQKRTNHCTSYAIAKVVSIMLTRRLRKQIFIDPEKLWLKQLESGASENIGDSLQNAVRCVVTNGCEFNDYDPISGKKCTRKVSFDGAVRVFAKDFDKWLLDGHPIFTGVVIRDNFIINNVIDMDGREKGKHAIAIIAGGGKKFKTVENSWGSRWGLDGTCLIKNEDCERLMSSYVLVGMQVL